MNRAALETWIGTHYGVQADHPWMRSPTYAVFRHADNQKWFAVIMDIPQARLGLPGEEMCSVVNLKCDPLLIGSLRCEAGFFPAYHMNKANWITVLLNEPVPDEPLAMLVDMSFQATQAKKRPQKRK